MPETVPVAGHCLYLIFLPFVVCSGSAVEEVGAGTSVSAAASATVSLVAVTMSERVAEAEALEVELMLAEEVTVGMFVSADEEMDGSLVGVGPTVEMLVSDQVEDIADQEDSVGEAAAMSASWYSVGEPSCSH